MTDSTGSDLPSDLGKRKHYTGDGVDSILRELLGRVADEAASRTPIAIVMPTKEILAVFHRVFDMVPHVPDYDPEGAEDRRWSTPVVYASDEIPDTVPELGVYARDPAEYNGDAMVRVIADGGALRMVADMDPRDAEQFFLAGLAAVREVQRQRAGRPVAGISDEEATATLAQRGIVIGGRATEADQATGKPAGLVLPDQD
jgi:hypothetical protein